ncbi:MAG TPA: ligase-associated DNA damage response endonuclease PdeM [Nevskiaceae bacterium]|nr:ligase-associated DNA damage response endonuclease PdeM [Nevskiaceae bacterium]
MKRELPLSLAGTAVWLLAGRALYWPSMRWLCVADAHFGKAAAFRALGQPVPRGTTADNLERLDALLLAYPTERLVFLGDFLHAPKSHAAPTIAAIAAWRRRHAAMHCTLIRGNHDRRAGDPRLDLEIVDEPLIEGPLALRHLPIARPGLHVVAGHEHPVFMLFGRGRQQLRLPCFHVTPDVTVLPSFGAFTGGHPVEPGPASRIAVTDGTAVWPVHPPHTIRG